MNDGETDTSTTSTDWKGRYQLQKLLLASITSLLNKYGNSVDVKNLYSAFLLTLMGHYVVSDSCYYTASDAGDQLEPALSYGRLPAGQLPVIPMNCALVEKVKQDHTPKALSLMMTPADVEDALQPLVASHEIVAPLFIKRQLVGLLFLGSRVSGAAYSDFDFEVLYALCAASATTFSNALLYRNARLSAREIEKLYVVRAEVISRISHEFRTPLTTMRGVAEMIANGYHDESIIEMLVESVDRMEELIETLLDLNTEDIGEMSEFPAAYDAIAVIQRSLTRKIVAARNKKVRFTFHRGEGGEAPSPRLSPESLTAVMDALLDNAIKFSPEATQISVDACRTDTLPDPEVDGVALPDWRTNTRDLLDSYARVSDRSAPDDHAGPARARMSARSRPTRQYLVVRVTDSGIGIPAEEIDQVSEPFRQGSNSPDLGIKGRGLGLAHVQKIVAMCGGVVSCRSELGKGTTMTVHLPAD